MVLRKFIPLALLAVSCSLDQDPVFDSSHVLIGAWDWQRTEDWDPEHIYEAYDGPEVTGKPELLEMKESGVFVKSVDGDPITQGHFYLYAEDSITFYHQKHAEHYRYHVKSGHLTLENVVDSGILITYHKTKIVD